MKRTAEKVLSIISAVLTGIGVAFSFATMAILNYWKSEPTFLQDFESEMMAFDPTLTSADMEIFYTSFDIIANFIWFIIIGLIISLILVIIGIINIWNNKNPKLAGILFIIAGLLGGILSLTSILLYIAGILCLTRKSRITDQPQFIDDTYDGTMRPL